MESGIWIIYFVDIFFIFGGYTYINCAQLPSHKECGFKWASCLVQSNQQSSRDTVANYSTLYGSRLSVAACGTMWVQNNRERWRTECILQAFQCLINDHIIVSRQAALLHVKAHIRLCFCDLAFWGSVTVRSGVICGLEMLYFIGLGLGDAKYITVKGLEIVRQCSRVYLEDYTSILWYVDD